MSDEIRKLMELIATASAAAINNIIGGMMDSFELFDAAIEDKGLPK